MFSEVENRGGVKRYEVTINSDTPKVSAVGVAMPSLFESFKKTTWRAGLTCRMS
jgi:hypothetical protein